MMRDHAAIEELLAVDALGGLDGDDRAALDRMLAEHGDCDECRRLRAGFAETAAAMASSLDPVPVDPSMVDRIVGGQPVVVVDEVAERRARGARRWVPIVAVAAVIALVGAFVVSRQGTSTGTVNWAQQVVAFDGETGEFAMAYVPGQSGVVFWGDGLPELAEGETLEIWMIDDDVPIKGACVRPADGRVAAFLDADVGVAEVMAVTVESTECPDAPTTEPIFTAPLV